MHTMQEDADANDAQSNGYTDASSYTSALAGNEPRQRHPRVRDTLLAVVGMLLPLLAQVGHTH